jgi:hypothetical protein
MSPEINILLQNFLGVVLAAFSTLAFGMIAFLSSQLVRFVLQKLAELKLQIGAELYALLNEFVKLVVQAAEQKFEESEGQKKLDYAVAQVQLWLKEHGLNLPLETIIAFIEAAIRQGYADGTAEEPVNFRRMFR